MQCSFHKYLLRTDYGLRSMLGVKDDKAVSLQGTHRLSDGDFLLTIQQFKPYKHTDNSIF